MTSVKQALKKAARVMAGWPMIGRLVRIAVAVVRLPELQSRLKELESAVGSLQAEHRELHRRQHAFETQQLPTLLRTLSELNHRQLASDADRDNLVRSVPVALRKITRELNQLRESGIGAAPASPTEGSKRDRAESSADGES